MNSMNIWTNIIQNLGTSAKKVIWHEWKKCENKLYSELNYFTEEYLRQQATYIKTREWFIKTANFTNRNTEKSDVETNIQTDDTSGKSNNIKVVETINDSNNSKAPPVEQIYGKLTDDDHELFETLQKGLFEQIEKYKLYVNKEQLKYVKKKPSDGDLKSIDARIKTYHDNLKEACDITFDDINTVVYYAAVTIKKNLKGCKVRKKV